MNTEEMPGCNCPNCGKEFDSVMNLAGGGKPVAGNWTICLACAQPLRFTDDLTVRALDEVEKWSFEQCPDFKKFKGVISALRELRKKPGRQ